MQKIITFSRLPRFTTLKLTLLHSASSKFLTFLVSAFCCLGSFSCKIAIAISASLKYTARIKNTSELLNGYAVSNISDYFKVIFVLYMVTKYTGQMSILSLIVSDIAF